VHWIYLILAGLLEIGWIFSLKHTEGFTKWVPMVAYAFFGFSAAYCLSLALKDLPVSTAYAVWMGIAVVGSTITGMWIYKEPSSIIRLACIVLIIGGIVGLKWTGTDAQP
jgi:quaternary ammonium compound-resistance protein SugE